MRKSPRQVKKLTLIELHTIRSASSALVDSTLVRAADVADVIANQRVLMRQDNGEELE